MKKNLPKFWRIKKYIYLCTRNAEVAQLVEHNLAKVRVADSSSVFRSQIANGGMWPLF